MTPTDALAVALHASKLVCWFPVEEDAMRHDQQAVAILAALPEGAALVTVESLAAVLWDDDKVVLAFGVDHKLTDRIAARIIAAVREPLYSPWRTIR